MSETFSPENLINLLDNIKTDIILGTLSESSQERLWNNLNWNKKDVINKELIKYLFTGYLIHTSIKNPITI